LSNRRSFPEKHGEQSIHFSLFKRLAAILFFSVLVLGALSHLYFSKMVEKEVQQKADVFMNSLTSNIGRLLWTMDDQSIRNIGFYYQADEDIVHLKVVNSFGEIVFSFDKIESDSVVTLQRNLFYNDTGVGSVTLGISTARFQAEKTRLVLTAQALAMAVGMILLIVTRFILRKYLQQPLGQLDALAKAYAAGNFDADTYDSHWLEFQEVVSTFRKMGQTIQAQIAKITQAEADYRNIFENTMVGIIQTTLGEEVIMLNPAMVQMTGFASKEECLSSFSNASNFWVKPEHRRQWLAEVKKHGGVNGFETELIDKNSKPIEVSIHTRGRFQDNTLVSLDSIVVNITERKRAEKELSSQRDLLLGLFDNIETPAQSSELFQYGFSQDDFWRLQHPKRYLSGSFGPL